MLRVEDKYDIDAHRMDILEHRCKALLTPDEFMGEKGYYTVSSIYFDDLSDSSYHDTVNGFPTRRKYRVRIYNRDLGNAKLEIKDKHDRYIEKKIAPITEEEIRDLIDGIPPEDYDNDVRKIYRIACGEKGLRPTAIVTYDRSAYTFEAGNVRITFDRNIRASRDFDRFGKKKMILFPADSDGILEVKYDTFLPVFIGKMLETGDMSGVSHSKYAICRDAILQISGKDNL